MERVDAIMERLGFNKEADDGTKAAFVKNLIKQAYGVDVPLPPQYELLAKPQSPQNMEDLNRDTLEGKPLPKRALSAVARATANSPASLNNTQLSFNLEAPTPNKAG